MTDPKEIKARVFDFLAAVQSLRYKSASPQVPLADQKPAREELAAVLAEGSAWNRLDETILPEAVTRGCFPRGLRAGCLKYLACRMTREGDPDGRQCESCSAFGCVTDRMVDEKLRDWSTSRAESRAGRGAEPLSLALTVDGLCPFFHRLQPEAQNSRAVGPAGAGHVGAAIENPFRFLQCFLAMNDEGRARRLSMPGMPLAEGAAEPSEEARRCAGVLAEAGISGIAIIGRDDLHKKTYHLQGGSSDPGVAHYYEIPDFWFGENREASRQGFDHVLRKAFHATRSTSTEEAPELHKHFNRRAKSTLPSSPFERRIGVLYCPDGELTFAILHWRLLLFANACSTSGEDPPRFQGYLQRLRGEILTAIERSAGDDRRLWAELSGVRATVSQLACRADLEVLKLLAGEMTRPELEQLDLPGSFGLPFPGEPEQAATPAVFWSLAQELVTQALCDRNGAPTERFLGLQAWIRGLCSGASDDSLFPDGWPPPPHRHLLAPTAADLGSVGLRSVAMALSAALGYWQMVTVSEEGAADGPGCLRILLGGLRFPHLPYYLWRSKGAFALGHLAFPVAHSHMSVPDDLFVDSLTTRTPMRDERIGAIGYFAAGFKEELLRRDLLAAHSAAGQPPCPYYDKTDLMRWIRVARLLGEGLAGELAIVNFSQGFLEEEYRTRHAEREAFVETTMHYLSKRLDPIVGRLVDLSRDTMVSLERCTSQEFYEVYERGSHLTVQGMVLERMIAGMRDLDEEVTRFQWLDIRQVAPRLDSFFSDLRQYKIGEEFHLCHWLPERVEHLTNRVPIYAIYRILYVMIRNYEVYLETHLKDPEFCRLLTSVDTSCRVCGKPKRGSEISVDFDAVEVAIVIRQRNPFLAPEAELFRLSSKGTGIRLDIARIARSRRLFSNAQVAGPRVNNRSFELEVKLWIP